jgi:hypothetical protein
MIKHLLLESKCFITIVSIVGFTCVLKHAYGREWINIAIGTPAIPFHALCLMDIFPNWFDEIYCAKIEVNGKRFCIVFTEILYSL